MGKLIDQGKSKGFLTYAEVNDALGDLQVGAEQMDDVLTALDGEAIEVVSDTSKVVVASRQATASELEARTKPAAGVSAPPASQPPPSR